MTNEDANQAGEASVAHQETQLRSSRTQMHKVLPICTGAAIVKWVKETVDTQGLDHIDSKSVKKFPQFLRGKTTAKIERAKWLLESPCHVRE